LQAKALQDQGMDRALLEEMLAEGLSLAAMGRRLGVHESTVAYWLERHGLRPLNAEKHAARGGLSRGQLEPLVEQGMTIAEIAERLDRSTPLHVVEATDGMELTPGWAYIAPGDSHLVLHRRGTATLTQLSGAPPENSCRPAVDVMFRSVATIYGASAFATVLTGMGQDGRGGAKVLRDAGAEILAQDEATSVVWGMPGAVVGAGLADEILPLDRIAAFLVNRVKTGRSAAVAR